MHSLWLQHHQSILDLHVAETIFALARGGNTSSRSISSWFNRIGGKGKGGEKVGEASIEWVDQADTRAKVVIKALDGTVPKSGGSGKKVNKRVNEQEQFDELVELAKRWTEEKEIALVAGRVLRDAKRVRATAERSRTILQAL
nr:uncharacterized protein BN887_02469 [Melanopsichium pennsylvanicum 4]